MSFRQRPLGSRLTHSPRRYGAERLGAGYHTLYQTMSGFIRVAGIVILYAAAVFFLLGLGDYRGIEALMVLGLPVLLSSWFFGLVGGAMSGIASLIFSVPFVPDSKILPLAGLCYLAVGGGLELSLIHI